jgi:hypothetical protein
MGDEPMTTNQAAPKNKKPFELSLFCGRVGDGWRVHVWPGWLPGYLRNCFDADGEACPVYLDLDELDRQMEESGVEYRKIESPIGGFELTAEGDAATVLAVWLSEQFASGKRVKRSSTDESVQDSGSSMTG